MTLARVAISGVFFLHGASVGTWVSRIPAVQERLHLSEAALGLVLLGAGAGSLLAMVPAGALIARIGSRRMVAWMAVATAGGLVAIALAAEAAAWALFLALALSGAASSALDVSMNAQGSALEVRLGKPAMSSLHGLWSLGNMAGVAAGAGLAALGTSLTMHFAGAALVVSGGVMLLYRPLLRGDEGHPGPAFAWPRGALLALAAIAFCAVLAEGAMLDWSGVYLRRVLGAPEPTAALGASFFSAAMAAGRLGGDHLTARLSAPVLARLCATVAAAGVGIIILAPREMVVFGGLLVVGLGLSVLVPLAFGAAGLSRDAAPGAAIAAVATVGYVALLAGPPVIGLVAQQVTLRGAFALLLVALAATALLAPATRAPRTSLAAHLSTG